MTEQNEWILSEEAGETNAVGELDRIDAEVEDIKTPEANCEEVVPDSETATAIQDQSIRKWEIKVSPEKVMSIVADTFGRPVDDLKVRVKMAGMRDVVVGMLVEYCNLTHAAIINRYDIMGSKTAMDRRAILWPEMKEKHDQVKLELDCLCEEASALELQLV